MTEDEKAIRDLVARWIAASKANDHQKVASMMTDDVLFMVPGAEPFDKERFVAAAKGNAAMKIDGQAEVREVVVTGDWAWARTHLMLSITRPDGETMKRTGSVLSIYKRENGAWKLHRDANLLSAPKS